MAKDCNKEVCAGCGIAYFEIADSGEQMHGFLNRFGEIYCLCTLCKSNLFVTEEVSQGKEPTSHLSKVQWSQR